MHFSYICPTFYSKYMPRSHQIPSIDEFKKKLKAQHLKATAQRLAVHEAMMQLGHASADMVADAIREKGTTSITSASVYNILSHLAYLGIYHYRFSSNNKMYFDVVTAPHIHLYDTVSNEFKDIVDEEIMGLVNERMKNRRFKGFKIDGVDIQIICHPSRKKNSRTI